MGIIERLRRPDWLQEMQTMLTVVLAVLAVLGVLDVIAVATGDSVVAAVPTRAVFDVGAAPATLQPGTVIDQGGMIDVSVSDPDAGLLIGKALTSMPTYVVAVITLALLLSVVRRARKEDPFLPATVRRLRTLAVVALVGGPVAFIIEMIAAMDLTARVTDRHPGTVVDLTSLGIWLLIGFGFFAIAEVINRGRAMRAELDSVI
jgi:Protein of unknown function (DUF2975)